jgi:hypothetical protein
LKKPGYIRRLGAAFFLLLFSFCVTPKRFLHDLLANHLDLQSATNYPVEHISSSGFQCHADDLVVMQPFLPEIQNAEPLAFTLKIVTFPTTLAGFKIRYLTHSDSRGPPAAFCS